MAVAVNWPLVYASNRDRPRSVPPGGTQDLVAYTRGEATITTASDVFQRGLMLAELFSGVIPVELQSISWIRSFLIQSPISPEIWVHDYFISLRKCFTMIHLSGQLLQTC